MRPRCKVLRCLLICVVRHQVKPLSLRYVMHGQCSSTVYSKCCRRNEGVHHSTLAAGVPRLRLSLMAKLVGRSIQEGTLPKVLQNGRLYIMLCMGC